MRSSASLVAAALVALAGCGPDDDAAVRATEGVLAGTVSYRERVALPADAMIGVRLEDVSRADVAATVLAEQRIAAEGRQVPVPFELRYPAERIEANRTYGVRAEIRAADGELMFTTTTHHGVLQGGEAPSGPVDILLERVSGGDAAAASDATITGDSWRLTAIRRPGAAEEPVGPDPEYTVQFGADGRYSGRAHCNSFTGGYERAAPGEITIRAGAATLAACLTPSIADEFLRALASVTSYEVTGDQLRLAYNTGGELTFVRAPPQAAAAPGVEGTFAEPGRTYVYDCDGDLSFTVRPGAGEVAFWAPESLGGAYQVLSMTRAASGVRYQEGDTVFWTKGDLATIEIGGQRFVDCRSNPSKVPWADAKRRGAIFRGLGQEPGWFVEIFADRLALVTDTGTNRTEAKHSGAVVDAGRMTYRTAEGPEVTIVIDRQPCADIMSGEPFEAAVTASIENRTLKGCGRFL
ncbi:MAG TPA: YbaY family lipoprotein [Gammaproteobacteria bacterium]